MAADEIQIARAGFFMIHNAWTGLWGNRNDLRETADFLEQIDDTIADIYHVRSGLSMDELKADMDKERWINGRDAIDSGFADAFLPSDVVVEDTKNFTKEKSLPIKQISCLPKQECLEAHDGNLFKI
jgi:ATP-dependent protease ClpP protease subunit